MATNRLDAVFALCPVRRQHDECRHKEGTLALPVTVSTQVTRAVREVWS